MSNSQIARNPTALKQPAALVCLNTPWLQEEGSQLVELALIAPLLILLLVGVVDFGRAYFVSMEISSAAEAGATYGVLHPTDLAGMRAAALLDAPDLPNLSSSATYGSECSDGTSSAPLNSTPPTCTVQTVQYVEVDTSLTYQPILSYPGFTSFVLNGKSRMRATF